MVAIPLNRVKVSTNRYKWGGKTIKSLSRNPLKSGQGFNEIKNSIKKAVDSMSRNPLKSGQGFNID